MLQRTARLLESLHVTPNALTLSGAFLCAGAGLLIARGHFFAAGWMAAAAGFCDFMDGRVAKLKPAADQSGALLDSSIDRYSDAFLYGGFLFFFAGVGEWIYSVLAFSALVAAFEISYVRARAEGLGMSCRIGLWERGERTALLILSLLLVNPEAGIILLGIAPHSTAMRRLIRTFLRLKSKNGQEPPEDIKSRTSPGFIAASLAVILVLIFARF